MIRKLRAAMTSGAKVKPAAVKPDAQPAAQPRVPKTTTEQLDFETTSEEPSDVKAGVRGVCAENVEEQQEARRAPRPPLRRSNTCGSLFVECTLALPQIEAGISALALRIHGKIASTRLLLDKRRWVYPRRRRDPAWDCFESGDDRVFDASKREICFFICDIYAKAEVHMEGLVTAGVLLERILTKTNCLITATNWRNLVLSSLILASKLCDDEAPPNSEWRYMDGKYTPRFINTLEGTLLRELDFKVAVSASAYAAYYFELRSISLSKQPRLLSAKLASRISKSHRDDGISKDPAPSRMDSGEPSTSASSCRFADDTPVGYYSGRRGSAIEQLVNMAPQTTANSYLQQLSPKTLRHAKAPPRQRINICSPDLPLKSRLLDDSSSSYISSSSSSSSSSNSNSSNDDNKQRHHPNHHRQPSNLLAAVCSPSPDGECH